MLWQVAKPGAKFCRQLRTRQRWRAVGVGAPQQLRDFLERGVPRKVRRIPSSVVHGPVLDQGQARVQDRRVEIERARRCAGTPTLAPAALQSFDVGRIVEMLSAVRRRGRSNESPADVRIKSSRLDAEPSHGLASADEHLDCLILINRFKIDAKSARSLASKMRSPVAIAISGDTL